MDRHFERQGVPSESLTPLDRLLYLGSRTMGALTYHPSDEQSGASEPLNLQVLAKEAQRVQAGHVEDLLPALIRAGGSPGGARPKILVGVKGDELLSGEDDLPEGFEPWLVKFRGHQDPPHAGLVEAAYADMARAAGISVPPVRVFETPDDGHFFGVSRFDRLPGNRRLHMHTLGGLIHSNFRIPNCDYRILLNVTRTLTRNHQEVVECYRRLVFNVMAHNHDDHVKNFAFLMDDEGEWSLSPAYDLNCALSPLEHSMAVNGKGTDFTRSDLLSFAEEHQIDATQAGEILDQVQATVATWPQLAAARGCSRERIKAIARVHRTLR
jgi:serine/threonine-protein kinase HipA